VIFMPTTQPDRPIYFHDGGGGGDRDAFNHVHVFVTMANVAQGHQHMLLGTSSPAIPRKGSHVHRICEVSSFDPKNADAPHWHEVNVMTGPSLSTPEGEHTHYFAGKTSFDRGHSHTFSTMTDTSPDTPHEEQRPENEPEDTYGKPTKR
jgi:hypothetical protein